MTLVKTNPKHHLKLFVSFVTLKTKSDRARTQVVVQAQQHKALLQAQFQQWLFRRAIAEVDQVQLGMPTSACAQRHKLQKEK